MIHTLSQIESARRDTVFTRADGYAIDRLSTRLLDVPRPHTYPRDAWAKMLEAFVYQPRGTFRCVFGVLDALFSPWAKGVVLSGVSIDANGFFNHAELTNTYAGRWAWFTSDNVDVAERLVFVRYTNETTTPTPLGVLSTIDTAYWEAWSGTDTGTLRFLPFMLVESDCLITLYLDAALVSAPPTYLQSPDGSARPQSQPYGGHLLNLFDLDPLTLDYGDQINGPFPLYLTGEDTAGIVGHLMRKLLVAGVQMVVRLADFDQQIGFAPLYSLPRYRTI